MEYTGFRLFCVNLYYLYVIFSVIWQIMSWIKKNFSCCRRDKHKQCDCHKTNSSKLCSESIKLEVSDKNIQCDLDEEFNGEHVENRGCDKGNL